MIEELKEIRKDLFEAMEAKDNVLIGFGINRLDTLIHKLASDGVSADVSGFSEGSADDSLAGVGNWHSLDVQPPDTLVEVQDENGNIAKAYPTYYPFKLGENKTGRKWGSEVIHCEPYWDGGWMIECQGLESNIDSNIVRWRACC